MLTKFLRFDVLKMKHYYESHISDSTALRLFKIRIFVDKMWTICVLKYFFRQYQNIKKKQKNPDNQRLTGFGLGHSLCSGLTRTRTWI